METKQVLEITLAFVLSAFALNTCIDSMVTRITETTIDVFDKKKKLQIRWHDVIGWICIFLFIAVGLVSSINIQSKSNEPTYERIDTPIYRKIK